MNPAFNLKWVAIGLPLSLMGIWVGDFILNSKLAMAQSIVPEPNSTNTLTNQVENRVDITGGKVSGDGANLFHSFTQFNVESGQIANFVSQDSVQNILTRVVGGDASVINGLIQVSGGNPNLFIMNPAGVIFGADARLNIPASLTVTTATGIGLDSGWFNAVGANNYAALVGTPNAFVFSPTDPGSIINAGQLEVSLGENISLFGSNIINTGTLRAPGGQISLAAIPGQSVVRISQVGHLLNLEIATTDIATNGEIDPLSLPELLTGGDRNPATGVTVLADGTIELTATQTPIPTTAEVAVVSGVVDASASTGTGGSVNMIGESVGVLDGNIDVSGLNGGGVIRIGGDRRGNGSIPNASYTFVNPNSTLTADAEVTGDGGEIMIWSDQSTQFFGNMSAQGENGGFAEISSLGSLRVEGTVDLTGKNGSVGTLLLDPLNIIVVDGSEAIEEENSLLRNQIRAENNPNEFTISETTLEKIAETADIVLEARDNIKINDLSDNQLDFQATTGSVTFIADADRDGQGSFTMNSEDTIQTAGGTISINAANLDLGNLITNGGDINLIATFDGDIETGQLVTGNEVGAGGDISITAPNGSILTEQLQTRGLTASGNIILNSGRLITTADISTQATGSQGEGGNVILNGNNNIEIDLINTSGRSQAGDITITTNRGNITLGSEPYSIDASSANGSGGEINLFSPQKIILGLVDVRGGEVGGNINLNSELEITVDSLRTNANGNIILTSDEINLKNQIEGTGNLILQPATDAQDIVIGDSEERSALSLDLTADELANLGNGFDRIRIGREDSKGTITIAGDVIFQDPIVIQSPLGQILTENSESGQPYTLTGIENSSLNFTASRDIFLGNVITNGQDITITSSSGEITAHQIQNSGFNQTSTIQLMGNEINFIGGNNSVRGNGILVLQPTNIEKAIILGTENTDALDISYSDLAAIGNGFNGITIGRMDSNAPLTIVGDVTFRDPVKLQGSITGNGNLTGLDDASITIESRNNIQVGDINSSNRSLSLSSTNGQILTRNLQAGETINLTAEGNIQSNNIQASQEINLSSNQGEIVTGHLTSQTGENIIIEAGNRILTGTINTNSTTGTGGNVQLIAPNDIEVVSINTEGRNKGGNIDITTNRFFRATGTFEANNQVNVSLSSMGAEQGGNITIQQGTDNNSTPLIIGESSINGTAGAITDGNVTVSPNQFISNPTNFNLSEFTEQNQTPENNSDTQPENIQNQQPSNPDNNRLDTETPAPINLVDSSEEGENSENPNLDSITEGSNQTLTELGQEVPEIPVQIEDTTIAANQISSTTLSSSLMQIELFRGREFIKYFGESLNKNPMTDQNIRQTLNEIDHLTGYKPAIIYVSVQANQLEMRLVLPEGQPIFKSTQVNRDQLLQVVRTFTAQIRTPQDWSDTQYKIEGKKLYDWLILPLMAELEKQDVKTLIFSMDTGLRTLPIAALYDGQKFLLEDYSLGLIPSLSLTDTSYVNLKNSKVLAMGASEFSDPTQQPLPAVPLELSLIVDPNRWPGQSFLNQEFTIDNLTNQRSQKQFDIIHLATHGEFQAGGAQRSYIQFWERKLWLNELRKLRLDQPPVELLVLSACTTAVGDEEAELGFAGLAIQAGVKSALASLWYVSDAGTLGLMSEFYQALLTSPIKAEALRQAQLAMLQGSVHLEAGKLRYEKDTIVEVELPPEIADQANLDLSHPFYWAGFTLIGSPW